MTIFGDFLLVKVFLVSIFVFKKWWALDFELSSLVTSGWKKKSNRYFKIYYRRIAAIELTSSLALINWPSEPSCKLLGQTVDWEFFFSKL